MPEGQNTYMIKEEGEMSSVKISDEVVPVIAGLAATEVKGVACLGGGITNSMVARKGIKALSKGVKVTVTDQQVRADLIIHLEYGYNIPEVAQEVQDKVRSAIENMIGMTVTDVNVKVAGIAAESED